MRVLQQWLVLWKGSRLLAEVFWKWRYSRRTALHLNRRPPTLPSLANMCLNHRYPPTLRKCTKARMPFILQHLLSPYQTPRSLFTLHRRRKPQSRIRNHISTIMGSSYWPTILVRPRVDAILETLYRFSRMPTSLSLHLLSLNQLS